MHLTAEQSRAVEQRIAAIEARTGVQVVVALIGRCDAYPEIRWKAFALAAAFAALAVVGADLLNPGWNPGTVEVVVAILAAGASNALLAQFVPAWGRRFVRDNRAEAEARDYARSLFLERGLHETRERTAVLLMLGLYERVVVVQPDEALSRRIGGDGWQAVVRAVAPRLAAGDRPGAIEAGLQALGDLLEGAAIAGPAGRNALPDRPIQERGA